MSPKSDWGQTHFNGILAPGLLCLFHANEVKTASGNSISLRDGMVLTAYDQDADEEGKSDNIFTSGSVERSPSYAQCNGSVWSLRIDSDGTRHESDIARK